MECWPGLGGKLSIVSAGVVQATSFMRIARLSPLVFEHINLLGRYAFSVPE